MKVLVASILTVVSGISFAATEQPGDSKLFSCMDAKTFELNSQCLSKKIESNMVYKQAQTDLVQAASDASDRAIATMTFNPETFTIEVVAHKDALLAKID
jgi:uncharacterized protein YjiK